MLLNEYDVGEAVVGDAGGVGPGGIAPHNDGSLFVPAVAIFTLGTGT